MIRLRTGYSFRTAVGTLADYAALLKDEPYWPITDRASSYGWVKWDRLAREAGATAVLGIELAVSPDPRAKRPAADHWTFYSRESGVEPLAELVALAQEQFRYQPLLTYGQAVDAARSGAVVAVAGSRCLPGHLAACARERGVYGALAPSTPPGLLRAWLAAGLPLVAASDNYYPTPDHLARYQVIVGRGSSTQVWPQEWLGRDGWATWAAGRVAGRLAREALDRADRLLAECSRAHPVPARLPDPRPQRSLLQKCRAGAAELGLDLDQPDYAARLKRELDMIESKQFGDYFHIVSDLVRWARARMMVGPARGSAAGSLVCYCLGITTVDPLKYGLVFERFIDINRPDLPDIDVDFSDARREEAVQYLRDRYGDACVSRLGTVNVYKSRSALREACGALKIPFWEARDTLNSMIQRSSGDARAQHTLADTFEQLPAGRKFAATRPEVRIVQAMEGHPRHAGQHASAVLVGAEPISRTGPLSREGALMYDKKDAEALDLLKIDVLGLKQLSVLEEALALAVEAGMDLRGRSPYEYLDREVPTDPLDPGVVRVFDRGRYAGIFQVQGIAVQNIASSIDVTTFDDIIALSALGRPGPLASGNATRWVKRRKGLDGPEEGYYWHEEFEPYLSDTYGVVIYQEQIMTIGREIGGLSWGDVTALRKAMSKSLGVEFFNQFGDRWKAGAAAKTRLPMAELDQIWNQMCEFGSWGFNKSHAVSYGLITYWGAYMKAHWPLQFAAATLNSLADLEKQQQVLRELDGEGISYTAVDPAHSTDRWRVADGRLVGPLQAIKGIGPASVETILNARSSGTALKPGLARKLATARTPLDELYPLQAWLDKHGLSQRPGRPEVLLLTDSWQARQVSCGRAADMKLPTPGSVRGGRNQAVVVAGVVYKINRRDENEAVNVAKRGGTLMTGQTQSLNLWMQDDTGKLFAKVGRKKYLAASTRPINGPQARYWGKDIVDRGRAGTAVYLMWGVFWDPGTFRMLMIEHEPLYLGDLEAGPTPQVAAEVARLRRKMAAVV